MAGDWIKMRAGLWDHPKVVRILSAICPQNVRDLSMRCRVIGALYRTWSLADQFTEDGVIDGYDADALDATVGIDGWSASLQGIGWLSIEPQRLIVPRFEDHNGASAKRRAEDSKRKKSVRNLSADCPQEPGQTADQRREEKSNTNTPGVAPVESKTKTKKRRAAGPPSGDVKAAAVRVSDHYRSVIEASYGMAGAQSEIVKALVAGTSEADLIRAVDRYAADAKKLPVDRRTMAKNFFAMDKETGLAKFNDFLGAATVTVALPASATPPAAPVHISAKQLELIQKCQATGTQREGAKA